MARSVSVPHRFSIAYLALAALLGAAIGTFIVLVERSGQAAGPPWSSWRPTASERIAQQKQIASHVSSQYRLNGGAKLVNVVAFNPKKRGVQDITLTRTMYPRQRSDYLSAFEAERTAFYVLCGTGQSRCAINQGKPTVARNQVLRREALELALYTFRYDDDTDSMVAFFPEKDLPWAMYVTKSELRDQLGKPLGQTLPQVTSRERTVSPTEGGVINELTIPRLYRFDWVGPDGSKVLLLAPR